MKIAGRETTSNPCPCRRRLGASCTSTNGASKLNGRWWSMATLLITRSKAASNGTSGRVLLDLAGRQIDTHRVGAEHHQVLG